MKINLIFLALIILSIRAYSQSGSNISVAYGTPATNVDIHGAIGDFGYNQKTGIVYGLTYTRELNRLFSLETGLLFAIDKAEESSIVPGRGNANADGNIKLISVPVLAKFTFFKYFYADAGTSIDKETNYTNTSVANDQSGLGFELGVGAQYALTHLIIFVNPYVKQYGAIRFDSGQNFNLLEDGFKFGIGYRF
jgi:opacity protein-like surface antigen